VSSPDSNRSLLTTREVIDELFTAAKTGVTSDVLAWWQPDGVLDDITLARRFAGHAELYPYLDWYYRALPDLDFTPARIVVDGDLAAVEWAERCHLEGPFDGLPADGRELRLRALDLFGIRDGKVAWESSWYGDGWLRRRLSGAADDQEIPPPLPRGPSWMVRSGPDRRGDASTSESRAVIRSLFAAAAEGDTEGALRWWSDGGVLDDVTIARRIAGKDALRSYLADYYRSLPDLHFLPRHVLVDGPWAVVDWAETCHVAEAFDGVASAGRVLRLRGVDVFEIRDGVVVHESGWYGDGWFRDRLEGAADPSIPPELPLGPAW